MKNAFRTSFIVALTVLGFRSKKADAKDFSFPNNPVCIERIVSNHYDLKIEGKNNPSTIKGFIFPPVGSNKPKGQVIRPINPDNVAPASADRPVSGFVPYRTPPKSYDRAFGGLEGHRPKKGGNGDDNPPYKNFSAEFEDFEKNASNKTQAEIVEYPTFSSYLRNKINEIRESKNITKKIKKLPVELKFEDKIKLNEEQLSKFLKKNKKKIVYRVHDSKYLIDAAVKTVKNPEIRGSIESLIEQMRYGNISPGSGSHKVRGLRYIWESRSDNGTRVYYQYKDQIIEIVAVSNKENQNDVIAKMKKLNY